MFELFRRRYGAVWLGYLRASGMTVEQAGEHWLKELADLMPAEIAASAGAWKESSPPGVMELRQRALSARPKTLHHRFVALPVPACDEAVAQAHLELMKGLLRRAHGGEDERAIVQGENGSGVGGQDIDARTMVELLERDRRRARIREDLCAAG